MTTTVTQLLCNNFGGISRIAAEFSSEKITCSDCQNVELYSTEMNNGVGVRTAFGNKLFYDISTSENLVSTDEVVVGIFESIQRTIRYCFIYTESETANKGRIYLFDIALKTLTPLITSLTKTGNACGTDFQRGVTSDIFCFSNGDNYVNIELTAKTLYAYVYSGNKIYADKSSSPTVLYEYDGEAFSKYSGTTWTISGGSVKYNNNTATYTSGSNVSLTYSVEKLQLKDVNGSAVKGLGCCVYNDKLWLFYDNILICSYKGDCTDFSTHASTNLNSAWRNEFTKNITAICPYLGSLAVFFADSSCLVTGDYPFNVGDDSPGGCASYNSFVFHDTELYFYDDTKKAVYSFSQVVNGEKILSKNIALEVQEELLSIKRSELNKIRTLSVVQSKRNEIWFLLPTNDATYSTILIFDYIHGEWVKRKSQKLTCFNIINDVFYSCDNAGNILNEYNGDTFNGEYIQHFYNCSIANLGIDNALKILYFPPRVTLDSSYGNNFYVRYIRNYDAFKHKKIRFIKAKGRKNILKYDSGIHYDSTDPKYYYPPKKVNAIYKFPSTTFKTLEIRIYTDEAGQDFSISNIEFSKIKVKQI